MTLLMDLVRTSQRVGDVSARRAKVRELADLLEVLTPDEIDTGVQFLSGELPQGRIGIAFKALQAAAVTAAEEATLSIAAVDRALRHIDALRGTGSAAGRTAALRALMSQATAVEQQFLVRLMVGELRQGALVGVMIEAIAAAAAVPTEQVRRAAMYARSLGAVARVALQEGAGKLAEFQLELFAPAAPMLAQTAVDAADALRSLGGEAAWEWKMDGARIQVHKAAGEVRVYTRALHEVTGAVPEIVDAVRALAAATLVLDGEAIAFDAAERPHPFQVSMRRFGRKLNVESMRVELPIRAFFFDCLYADGHSIVDRPYGERIEVLTRTVSGPLCMPRLITSSAAEANAFYDAAIAAGHEGLMAKSLEARYEAGNRGASWFKIKRAHTLDLVVLAAEWGHGRRSGKLSNLHLGAQDPATGEYVMLGKTFKGLTDAMLEWQTKELLARENRRDAWTVYVRPEVVVEVAFSDLQASTRYPGGLALRLARVKRYREDKRAEQADTMTAVRRIYAAQSGVAGPPSGDLNPA
jgi:DNA ligase-1